jgi:hypothetical protein
MLRYVLDDRLNLDEKTSVNDHDIAFMAAIAAAVAALGAIAALYYSYKSTRAAECAAGAAEEQSEIQRQLRIDAVQPYVWVDVRPDEVTSVILNLVIGNSGPTVATNVLSGSNTRSRW